MNEQNAPGDEREEAPSSSVFLDDRPAARLPHTIVQFHYSAI